MVSDEHPEVSEHIQRPEETMPNRYSTVDFLNVLRHWHIYLIRNHKGDGKTLYPWIWPIPGSGHLAIV